MEALPGGMSSLGKDGETMIGEACADTACSPRLNRL